MLKALIVDNDINAISSLEVMLDENCPQVNICGKVNTIADAFHYMDREAFPDIVFTEIDLPNGDGFRLVSDGPAGEFEVIFVTGNKSYALKAIKEQAVGFLVKPVKKKELLHVVQLAEQRIHQRKMSERNSLLMNQYVNPMEDKDTVGIPTIDGFEILRLDDVVRCEGMQNCTRIITRDRSDIVSSYNLGKFIKLFGEEHFFSPHKSHLVNFRHVRKFLREGTIIMKDGSQVPVSKRRKNELLKYFKHF